MTLPRTEFGFARTEGACEQFVDCCEILPAYLVPSDIEAIAAHLGYDDLIQFAMENLLASSGAIVRLWQKLARIPTLVPQRKPDHTCKFLDTDKRCAIHAVSPFGFQYFDCRMSQREDDLRSSRGLQAIAREWMTGGLYVCLRETSVKKAKKVRPLSPPGGALRRIAAVADEEGSRPQFD